MSSTAAGSRARPKSAKNLKTKKDRWTAKERAERGRRPSRRPERDQGFRSERTRDDRPAREDNARPDRFQGDRKSNDRFREDRTRDDRSQGSWSRDDRDRGDRIRNNRDDRPRDDRGRGDRFRDDRFRRDDRSRGDRFRNDDRPRNDRAGDDRRSFDRQRDNRFGDNRSRDDRPRGDRFGDDRRRDDRPRGDRFRDDRPRDDRPRDDRSRENRFGDNRSRRDEAPGDRYGNTRGSRHDRFGDRERPARPVDEADQDLMTWTGPEEAAEADATDSGFAGFGLPEPLLGVLAGAGITSPFPIQAATIPDALAGRDVLGRAQTGSGKTLGFGLPLLARLAGTSSRLPRGLILVPTRELALQVADAVAPLAKAVGLSVTLIAGGMPYGPQRRAFEQGVDVVVATPGRLIDLLDQAICDLSAVEVTVLDEADHMADLGFLPAVTTLLDTVPAGGQRLLFSATLDSGINRLVRTYLSDPVTHQVDSDRASVATMSHHVVHVQPKDKTVLTAELAAREGRTVIFVRTQRAADRIAGQLREAGVTAGALHGGLTQGARTRILAAFKEGRVPALVATDVAARGIHVDDVGLVLQVDPPNGPKEYLHRAGRTARAGGSGAVVTLALPHQRRELDRLTRQAGVSATPVVGESGDAALADATGARTPSGEPISDADYQRLISPPKPPRGAGRSGQRPFRGRQGSGGRKGFGDRRGSGDRRRPRRDDAAALR